MASGPAPSALSELIHPTVKDVGSWKPSGESSFMGCSGLKKTTLPKVAPSSWCQPHPMTHQCRGVKAPLASRTDNLEKPPQLWRALQDWQLWSLQRLQPLRQLPCNSTVSATPHRRSSPPITLLTALLPWALPQTACMQVCLSQPESQGTWPATADIRSRLRKQTVDMGSRGLIIFQQAGSENPIAGWKLWMHSPWQAAAMQMQSCPWGTRDVLWDTVTVQGGTCLTIWLSSSLIILYLAVGW